MVYFPILATEKGLNVIDIFTDSALNFCADGRTLRFADHVFLLDEDGTVLASRAALPHPACGEPFFASFPLRVGEGRILQTALQTSDARTRLMQSKHGSLLAVCAPFGAVRLFFAVVPEGTLARALGGICAADEVPARFVISPACLAESVAADADPVTVRSYLYHWNVAFFLRPPAQQPYDMVAGERVLRTSLLEMAALFGCMVRYDGTGLGLLPLAAPVDMAALRAFAAVACLCARRAARTREVLFTVSRERIYGALLHALITPRDDAEPFAELRRVATVFAYRGVPLRAVRLSEGTWQFSIPFCRARVEAQGVKSFTAPPMPILPEFFDDN